MKKTILYLIFLITASIYGQDFDYYSNLINKTYGDKVSFVVKSKTLRKFGRNTELSSGTEEQVWTTGGLETLSTTNDITHFASEDDTDTQTMTVEGHTIDGNGDLTFATQNVTLAGNTKTALTTPLARITRAFNTSSTDFAGTVAFSKDVSYSTGTPASDIHMTIDVGNNQSLKAATTISKNDYWVISTVTFSVNRQQTANVDFKLQARLKGSVFRTLLTAAVSNGSGSFQKILVTPIIVPPNTDIRIMATSSANTTQVDAVMDGYLASVIN
jgi:hypothetical protein